MSSGPSAVFSRSVATHELIGPFYLGIIVCYFLWGVQMTQSYHYYKSYRKTDTIWLKLAVGLLFITDAIQSICASEVSWYFMVDKWGDFVGVEEIPAWGTYMMPFMDALTAAIVHCFYAHKIWKLLKPPYNRICTVIVLSLSSLQLTAGIGGTAFMFVAKISLSEFKRQKTWLSLWLVTASATDIVIAAIMIGHLSRSRTGFRQTDDIISKLILMTVETGLATSLVQITDIVVYLVWPLKPYHGVPTFMAPKVYSNSMLAVLNSRQPQKFSEAANSSRTSKPIDTIDIHTSQTVAVTPDDYEGKNTFRPVEKHAHMQIDDIHTSDLESIDSSPFSNTVGSV